MAWCKCTLGFSLYQSHWIGLNIFGVIITSVRVYVMRVQVCAIDKAAIDWSSISSAVVLKWRFSKISSKWTIGNPPSRLFKLYIIMSYMINQLCLIVLCHLLILQSLVFSRISIRHFLFRAWCLFVLVRSYNFLSVVVYCNFTNLSLMNSIF